MKRAARISSCGMAATSSDAVLLAWAYVSKHTLSHLPGLIFQIARVAKIENRVIAIRPYGPTTQLRCRNNFCYQRLSHAAIVRRSRYSPSEEGRKTRPLAFITRKVLATIIAHRVTLHSRPRFFTATDYSCGLSSRLVRSVPHCF